MRSKFWKVLPALVLTGALVTSYAPRAVAESDGWDSDGKSLVGTWSVSVTLLNCHTGGKVAGPFLSLGTFALGGTLSDTTSNPKLYPAERSPGLGVWQRTGRHTYRASTLALITVNGALVQTQKITQSIEIGGDPDEFKTTSASVEFFKPDGTLVASGCASALGKRLE
jgi:hypothetical protein